MRKDQNSIVLPFIKILYFLRAMQIYFLNEDSTFTPSSCDDSIASTRIDGIFNPPCLSSCSIFSKCSANRLPVWRLNIHNVELWRFDQIDTNWRNFEPTLLVQLTYIFLRGAQIDFRWGNSTLMLTSRLDPSNRVESTDFQATLMLTFKIPRETLKNTVLPLNQTFGCHNAKWTSNLPEKQFFTKKVDFSED